MKNVIVVGAGISGLMDAFALQQAGFRVAVYAKGPDPRIHRKSEHYSSTQNGELGRFISRFEGEHYLGDSPMYPDMKGAFQKHVTAGGWLAKSENELTDFDKLWLEKRAAASDDLEQMNKTERWYVQANGEAMQLWQEMILKYPDLFKSTDLLNTGILRLYDSEKLLNWAVQRHEKEAVLQRALTPVEVAKDYPYFANGVAEGYVAGGVEAPGFSFNIHRFTNNIIDYLSSQGVDFFWNHSISHIQISTQGLVQGLVADSGLVVGDNYAISPGAYADENLFQGTPSAGKIAGVAGRWMFMPAPKNFKRPVKIHGDVRTENGKKFPVVDVNLTHFTDDQGQQWLAVGGGYAYLGKPPFSANDPAFDLIDAENDRTVKRYLGPIYDQAMKDGLIRKSEATCVRSFTYDDNPVMDSMPTESGGVLRINVGTNTGTTTISPFTARETVKALSKN